MKKSLKLYFTAIAAGAILITLFSSSCSGVSLNREFKPVFQKGMCYTTWNRLAYNSEKSDKSLEKLEGINVNWVAIHVTWYQDNCFATKIFPNEKTPSDESLKRAILKAREIGMKVMVKPHVDIVSTEAGSWRGEIACAKDPDWALWFADYTKFVVHYAKIAEETGAEMFCVGTELTGATVAHTEEWLDVISAVRKVYKGDLTYAANWNDEYLQVRFWHALDYAGIDAYFPLSNKDNPTYEELMETWKGWAAEIEAWQESVNKPVIFPEVGYRSSLGAARYPWEHASGPKVDLELQKTCYRALVDTFWHKDWFYGAYWWDWGTDVRMGGKFNRGFTPQNKPAQDYVYELYSKEVTR